jgi:hypothetical protein
MSETDLVAKEKYGKTIIEWNFTTGEVTSRLYSEVKKTFEKPSTVTRTKNIMSDLRKPGDDYFVLPTGFELKLNPALPRFLDLEQDVAVFPADDEYKRRFAQIATD